MRSHIDCTYSTFLLCLFKCNFKLFFHELLKSHWLHIYNLIWSLAFFSSGNVTLSFFKPCCSRCWSIWTVVFFQILVFNWIKFKVTFIFGLGGRKVKVKFFCGLVICIFEKSRETIFFFQNQAFNMVLRNVKLILSPITSHFYQKCKNIWQRLSDRHNLFSLYFSHEIGVKIQSFHHFHGASLRR